MFNLKKLVTGIATAAMALSFSVGAFAAEPGEILIGNGLPPNGNASYEATAPQPSTSVDVTFIMEAPNEYNSVAGSFYFEDDVTLTSNEAKTFTISDLLVQVANENNKFKFYTQSGKNAVPFTASSDYLWGVEYDNTLWQPNTSYFDLWGWEYRVNDLFPVTYDSSLGGYVGTYANQTYVSDGDVVHFFLNYPATVYGFDYASNFIRLAADVNGSDVTVQVQGQKTQLVGDQSNPQNLEMQVGAFANFTTPTVVKAYDANGGVAASGTSDATGKVTLSGLAAGTYTLKSDSALLSGDPMGEWDDCLFTQTTGYKVITVK